MHYGENHRQMFEGRILHPLALLLFICIIKQKCTPIKCINQCKATKCKIPSYDNQIEDISTIFLFDFDF